MTAPVSVMARKPKESSNTRYCGEAFAPSSDLKWPTVAQAEAALAAHEAACPGSYLECFGKPELETARLAWVEKKALLRAELDAARNGERQRWRPSEHRPDPSKSIPIHPNPSKSIPEEPMPARKTATEKLATMLARLQRLVDSGERKQASALRSLIRSLCEEHGLEVPVLPVDPAHAQTLHREAPELKRLAPDAPPDAEPMPGPDPEPVPHKPMQATTILGSTTSLALDLRRRCWNLLERVDALTEAERHDPDLLTALGNLDAAAHLVATLAATGRIEVAG